MASLHYVSRYRTRGPHRRYSNSDAEQFDKAGDYAHAPMFIMKPRSHVVWEKVCFLIRFVDCLKIGGERRTKAVDNYDII